MADATEAVCRRSFPLEDSMSPPSVPCTSCKSAMPQRYAASAPDLFAGSSAVRCHSQHPSQTFDDIEHITSSSSIRSSYSTPNRHQQDSPPPREHNTVPSSLNHDDEPSRSEAGSRERSPIPPDAETQAAPIENGTNMDLLLERIQDLRRTLSQRQRRASGPSLSGLWITIRGTFGYGPEGTIARKELVSLLLKILFGIGQIIAIITLSVIAAVRKSPTHSDLNEWQACHRPIGAWSAVWSIRVIFGCVVSTWAYQIKYQRSRAAAAYHAARTRETNPDVDGSDLEGHDPPGANTGEAEGQTRLAPRPANAAFPRLSSLLSLMSAAWFIGAHILLYASADSCRISSPHLWWLAFGIVAIGYLVIFELVFVVFLVFFITPVLFLIVNLVLICLGREPLRQGIKPEVGKLSAKAVDSIPLVLYIPAPTTQQETHNAQDTTIATPEAAHVHSYPPDTQRPITNHNSSQGTRVQSRSRRLFTFRRIKLKRHASKHSGNDDKHPDEADTGDRYEDKWEKGDYPFVKLEENRTTCAICLSDFEEPKRVRYSIDSKPPEDLAEAEAAVGVTIASNQDDGLRLADPGEGAQPLRLLDCAHVFHKTCIDPWLIEVSGRCPVCQRPVEVKEPPKSTRSRRQDRGW